MEQPSSSILKADIDVIKPVLRWNVAAFLLDLFDGSKNDILENVFVRYVNVPYIALHEYDSAMLDIDLLRILTTDPFHRGLCAFSTRKKTSVTFTILTCQFQVMLPF